MEDTRACWIGFGLQSHAAWVLAVWSSDLTSLRLRSVRRESQTVVPAVQTAACLPGACPQAHSIHSSVMLHPECITVTRGSVQVGGWTPLPQRSPARRTKVGPGICLLINCWEVFLHQPLRTTDPGVLGAGVHATETCACQGHSLSHLLNVQSTSCSQASFSGSWWFGTRRSMASFLNLFTPSCSVKPSVPGSYPDS